MTAIVWIARHWRSALFASAVLSLGLLLVARTQQLRAAEAELERERAARALFAERVRAVAAEAANQFNVEARRVENLQARITQEVSSDYQARLADLRRRIDARRLLEAARPQHPGGHGGTDLSRVSDAAGRSHAAAGDPGFSDQDRIVATEQALRLVALQDWVRRQLTAPLPTSR